MHPDPLSTAPSAADEAVASFGGEPGYTATEASRLAGLTRRRLAYLSERDLVVPALRRPGGRRLHYSFTQLLELRTIRQLTDGDDRTSVRKIRAVVAALREVADRPLLTCTLVVRDGEVLWADEDTRTLVDVMRGFQTVLVAVNLAHLETSLRRELAIDGLPLPSQRVIALTAQPHSSADDQAGTRVA